MDPELYVAVKPEYIKSKSSSVVPIHTETKETVIKNEEASENTKEVIAGEAEEPQESDLTEEIKENNKRKIDEVQGPKSGSRAKLTLKERHQGTHPEKEARLCSFVGRGDICPYEGTCQYSHDIFDYLSKKPADIGPVCYQYETFGYCPNGFMCRFGDAHIDRTQQPIPASKRKDTVIERVLINVLSKETQLLLRKKNFDKVHFPHIQENNRNKQNQQNNNNSNNKINKPTQASTNIASEEGGSEEKAEAVEPANNETFAEMKEENPAEIQPPVPCKQEYDLSAYPSKEIKPIDFRDKVYVAPLTTVGNLPFRRVVKDFGADITCGEMAMATNILQAQASEWALLRRHASEDCFGVQIAGNHPDMMSKVARILDKETSSDFVDLNCGCPIDVVCNRGGGSALMTKPNRLTSIVKTLADNLPSRFVTVKVRIGWDEKHPTTHKLIPQLQRTAPGRIAAIMIHGRSRLQRYHKLANWEYILQCAQAQTNKELPLIPIIGNGDIFSYQDWASHRSLMADEIIANANYDNQSEELLGLTSCAMLGRGVLIKPWLPQELKTQQTYDMSATERLDMLKKFWYVFFFLSFFAVVLTCFPPFSCSNYGFEHWGSDAQGVATTRRFLLEWLSFLHRYVPSGLLEYGAVQKMQQRPPQYFGRCDLETLLSSPLSVDWIRISELLLGPVPDGFSFMAKHKSNAYAPESEDLMNG